MKNFLACLGGLILLIVVILGIAWIVQGNDVMMTRVFGVAREDARREVFEHSKSFSAGMIQELQNMQFQYVQADDNHKAALGSIILHRVADCDETKMPVELRSFLSRLRRDRLAGK